MEDMDLSEDLEEILFLIEDNMFVRWHLEFNFFNQSIYSRLFDRIRFGEPRNTNLPVIATPPNTGNLIVSFSLLRENYQ